MFLNTITSIVGRVGRVTLSLALLPLLGGCISGMMNGDVNNIQTASDQPRAGNVYLIRGWNGAFSWGIDEIAQGIREQGIRAHVFRHEQRDELATALVATYRNAKNSEPLVLVAHSAGSDDALVIARELKKHNVPVDLIVTLDCVDETLVPGNVRLCYNYWVPKEGSSNFCRGLEFVKEPGSRTVLNNVDLTKRTELTTQAANHLILDKDKRLQEEVVKNVVATCPPRDVWVRTNGGGEYGSVQPAGAKVKPSGGTNNAAKNTNTRTGPSASGSGVGPQAYGQ